jgi:hypothetical protein
VENKLSVKAKEADQNGNGIWNRELLYAKIVIRIKKQIMTKN